MNFLTEHINSIALCLIELIVGILLLINPASFTSGIILIAGIVIMVLGLVEGILDIITLFVGRKSSNEVVG